MDAGRSFLFVVAVHVTAYAPAPESPHAQEATSGVVPTVTMEPGEPEQRLREFFVGDYDALRETWDYPSSREPITVSCTSVHSMEVQGFVLFVRVECEDGTDFLGLHSFDRRVHKYTNAGFSNGGGYIGSVYAEFQGDGSRYVGNAPTTDPVTGEAIRSRYACEPTDDGYIFESFLVRSDGEEVLTRRETYTRKK